MIGRTYLERGEPVVVLIRWNGPGPRNVLIQRADGSKVVRPFRGLRRPKEETPMPSVNPPTNAKRRDLQAQVITRDRGACQCRTGTPTACGRPHTCGAGRCLTRHTPAAPLHVVARDDIRPELAAALPPGDLIALCDSCHRALLTRRRKTRNRTVPVPDALF